MGDHRRHITYEDTSHEGESYIHVGDQMIPIPYKVRRNYKIPIPYKGLGTIRVIWYMWGTINTSGGIMIPIPYKVWLGHFTCRGIICKCWGTI